MANEAKSTKVIKKKYYWIEPDKTMCISCGTCVNYCPRDVLRMDKNHYPYMKYRDDCWYCDVCTFVCPKGALKLNELPYLIK